MSLAAQQLRKRKIIRASNHPELKNPEVENKIGQNAKNLLKVHDIVTVGIVGASFVATTFNAGAILIPILYLLDVMWVNYGHNDYTRTDMKTLYTTSLICTSLLALGTYYEELRYPFQIHIFTSLIAPIYILHRRNKKNIVFELIFVCGWLLLKIGLTWFCFIQYFNVANKLYFNWITTTGITPLKNPWTNPPIVLVTLVAFVASVNDMIQSYRVINNNHRII